MAEIVIATRKQSALTVSLPIQNKAIPRKAGTTNE